MVQRFKKKSPPRNPRHGGYSGHSPIERTNVFGGCRISSPFVGLLEVMAIVGAFAILLGVV